MTGKVTYDESFYAAMQDANLESARVVAPLVLSLTNAHSVIDVGCGRGLWLRAFIEQGVDDVFGIDGSWVKPENLAIPPEKFSPRDMESAIDIGRTADLVISLEVAEHLSPSRADDFVRALVTAAPVVLFSAAIPGQGGTDHRNEQWPQYWIERFNNYDFVPVDALRSKLWNDRRVAFFYAQNAILFVKKNTLPNYPKLQTLVERGFGDILPLVHPALFVRVHEDAERWKHVVPLINKLPMGLLKSGKKILSRMRGNAS